MDDNEVLEEIRARTPEGDLVDLLALLAKHARTTTFWNYEIREGFLEDLSPVILDYLKHHLSAWMLFDFLIRRLPGFSKLVLDAINKRISGPGYSWEQPESTDAPLQIQTAEPRFVGDSTSRVSFHHGHLGREVAWFETDGDLIVDTDTAFRRDVDVHRLGIHDTLRFSSRPSVTLPEERGTPMRPRTEAVQYFLFRCVACGGVFLFDSPYPNMYALRDGSGYACATCYTPPPEGEEIL